MQMLKYKLIIIEICFKFVRAMADNKIKPEVVRNSASRLCIIAYYVMLSFDWAFTLCTIVLTS